MEWLRLITSYVILACLVGIIYFQRKTHKSHTFIYDSLRRRIERIEQELFGKVAPISEEQLEAMVKQLLREIEGQNND
jgi:hypothetical protein